MQKSKHQSERKTKPRKQVVGRSLAPVVEPSCPSCGVPYVEHLGLVGTCAKLRKAVAVLCTIADPKAELHQDGRSIDRTYEDIALEVLIEIGEFNPSHHAEPRFGGDGVDGVVRSPVPTAAWNGFPFIVYHWTTRANALSILRDGLRRGSWVTPDPRHYKGEVLFGVCMDKAHDWASKDSESDWQAVLPKRVPAGRVFVIMEAANAI